MFTKHAAEPFLKINFVSSLKGGFDNASVIFIISNFLSQHVQTVKEKNEMEQQ